MASGSAVSLDTVMISIESDAGKATSNVDKLSSSLNTLKDSMSGGFGNLKKLAKYLDDLRSSAKGFGSVTKNIENLTTGLAPLKELSNIPSAKGLGQITQSLKDLPTTFSKINPDVLSNVSRVSSQLSEALTPLSDKLTNIANGFNAISKLADKYGVSVSKVYNYTKRTTSITKVLSNGFKSVGNAISKVAAAQRSFLSAGIKRFDDLKSKIKQIGLSLLGTRTLFTMLRKAVSEYMAMDEELTKYTTNVWRAFGAQLAPAIEYAMYLFKQFVRVIYSVVLALTGIDLISRANQKAMAAWGKSTKDTLGSLQKFDDLNVVEFNKNKSGGDGNDLINLDKIDLTPFQKIIDWVKKVRDEIKAAINTGEWYNVGKVFAEGINEGVEYLLNKLPDIEKKLKEIATQFAHFLNGVIENTNWGNIGKLTSQSIMTAINTLDTLIGQINWSAAGKGLSDYLTNLDLSGMLNSFVNLFNDIVKGLYEAISEMDWTVLGANIRKAIESVNWREVWDNIVNLAKESLKSLNDFLSGLTGIPVESFERLEKAIVGIGVALVTYKIGKGILDIGSALGTIGDNIHNLEKIPSKLGDIASSIASFTKLSLFGSDKNPLLSGDIINMKSVDELKSTQGILSKLGKTFTDLGKKVPIVGTALGKIGTSLSAGSLGTFALVLAAIAVAVLAIGTAFKELYEESEPFRKTVDELISSIKDTFLGVLDTLVGVVNRVKDSLVNAYNEIIKPLWDILVDVVKTVLEPLMEVLNILWKNIIEPIAGFLETVFKIAIDNVCTAFDMFVDVLSPVIDVLNWLWKNVLKPIVDFLLDVVVGAIKVVAESIGAKIKIVTKLVQGISTVVHTVWNGIWDTIKKIATLIYQAMIKPIADRFVQLKDRVVGAWEGIKNGISNVWEGIKSTAKNNLNWLIGRFESFLNKIIRGVNGLSKGFRKIGNKIFDIIGVDVKFDPLSEISLPRLATGTNNIPQEGPYYLHKGESVVPKKYNPALGGGTNEETNRKLDALIDAIDNMSFTNVVNIGNETMYKKNQRLNERMVNKYGTINL